MCVVMHCYSLFSDGKTFCFKKKKNSVLLDNDEKHSFCKIPSHVEWKTFAVKHYNGVI